MPFKIPSFVLGVQPTNAALDECRTSGLIQPAVTTFASAQDYTDRQPGPLPPTMGPAKWWADSNRNTAIGYFRFTGGSHKAGSMSADENKAYSAWARAFYTERPNLMVPEIEYVIMEPAEWGRLSFANSMEDPMEYPLGLVWSWGENSATHAFPADIVLFMHEGAPCFDRISKALELFKLTPQMPAGPGAATAGGYSASTLVATVKKAMGANTKATAIAAINAGGTDEQVAERLVKL